MSSGPGFSLYTPGGAFWDRLKAYLDFHAHAGADAGAQIDHGDLAGLSDDDHPQYGRLAAASNIFAGDMNIQGENQGQRVMMTLCRGPFAANAVIGQAGQIPTGSVGWIMPRAGSVVGFSVRLNITAQTTPGDLTIEIRKNNIAVFSGVIAVNGVAVYNLAATQARNTDMFIAGDMISMVCVFTSFVGTVNSLYALIELQMDS